MWPAKPKPDPELLGLFEESGAQRPARLAAAARPAGGLSRAVRARARHPARASRRATGSPTTSCTASRQRRAPRGARRGRRARARRRARRHRRLRRGGRRPARRSTASRRRWSRPQEIAAVLVGCAEQVAARAARAAQRRRRSSPHLVEIHRLENEGDRLQRAAVASAVRQRHRPDDADPLEGHLRHARGRRRRLRDGRERARGDLDQARAR